MTKGKDIKTLGLAAGGKLSKSDHSSDILLLTAHAVQDICKDSYPTAIWNHAAACILHVHILDPISCENMTHVVSRPPPKDPKAYIEAFGQFFVVEEKVDERLDGGDFDNLGRIIGEGGYRAIMFHSRIFANTVARRLYK